MTVEKALEIVQSVLYQGRLTKVQEIVFRQSWDGKSYQEIATDSDYEVGYITDVGSKLWQLLSKTFGKKVTKHNLHGIMKQQYIVSSAAQPRGAFVEKYREAQGSVPNSSIAAGGSALQYQDWGEAIDVSVFYGRSTELATLNQWIVKDRCRLVTLLGMGGIGKTALAVSVAEQVQAEFKYLIWRSLRNAPPIKEFLTELILFFSHQQEVNLAENIDSQLARLMKYLRSSRCLLILDNAESILCSGQQAGRYRSGHEGYGHLLRRVADERHQSCLLLTSREKPIGLTSREGEALPVRSLYLTGLGQAEAQEILKAKGLVSAEDESRKLIEYYIGNPLVLKIIATKIQSLFDADVSKFLEQETVVFSDIWELLDQQFNRLSTLEKQVMYWLAANRESVTLTELLKSIVPKVSCRELLEALESLQQRSLLHKHAAGFTQHSVVTDYMSQRGNTT